MNNYRWHIGDEVIVLDQAREYLCRGNVVGRYASAEPLYDIQPVRTLNLTQRLHCVPEFRLRAIAKPILCYERKPEARPLHILDEA